MSGNGNSVSHAAVRALVERYAAGDRSSALTLLALVRVAGARGEASLHDVAIAYRADYLAALRAEGRDADADAEAGRLSLDEVRAHLANVVFPRLASAGAIVLDAVDDLTNARLRVAPDLWASMSAVRGEITEVLRQTGEHPAPRRLSGAARVEGSSVLQAKGLVKTYRGRHVVNDVALELRQGEIVGLLGPNGAGKTTTF